MTDEERVLFAKLARVNANLGSVVMDVINHRNTEGITPYALNALADGLERVVDELRNLAHRRDCTATSQIIKLTED